MVRLCDWWESRLSAKNKKLRFKLCYPIKRFFFIHCPPKQNKTKDYNNTKENAIN